MGGEVRSYVYVGLGVGFLAGLSRGVFGRRRRSGERGVEGRCCIWWVVWEIGFINEWSEGL